MSPVADAEAATVDDTKQPKPAESAAEPKPDSKPTSAKEKVALPSFKYETIA